MRCGTPRSTYIREPSEEAQTRLPYIYIYIPTHHIPIHAQGYGSIFVADGIHAEALGLAQAGGQPVGRAALEAFLKVKKKSPRLGRGGGGCVDRR